MHATAYDVDRFDALARQFGSQAQGSPVCEGKAVEDGTRPPVPVSRDRLTQPATHLLDAGRHIARWEEDRIVWVEHAAKR